MDENKKLKLELTVKQWNRIRGAMGKLPYEQINDLFVEMDMQFAPQMTPQNPKDDTEETSDEAK